MTHSAKFHRHKLRRKDAKKQREKLLADAVTALNSHSCQACATGNAVRRRREFDESNDASDS
jgi:hypothetical protein